MITLWGLIYFLLNNLVVKYNLLYSYVQPYETGGALWPATAGFIAGGLVFFQMVMFGVFLSYRFWAAPAILVLIPLTIYFAYATRQHFMHTAKHGALERLISKGRGDNEDEEGSEQPQQHGVYKQPERERLGNDAVDLGEP